MPPPGRSGEAMLRRATRPDRRDTAVSVSLTTTEMEKDGAVEGSVQGGGREEMSSVDVRLARARALDLRIEGMVVLMCWRAALARASRFAARGRRCLGIVSVVCEDEQLVASTGRLSGLLLRGVAELDGRAMTPIP